MRSIHLSALVLAVIVHHPAIAQDGQANMWIRQDQAKIGPETPIAVVWSPKVGRFMSLGWISNMYDRRAPYTYD